jgi:hypothetical protein
MTAWFLPHAYRERDIRTGLRPAAVNRDMSFQDPPRRPRLSRYPAHGQHEDDYPSYQHTEVDYSSGSGYRGSTGRTGAAEQRAAWDDPPQQSVWSTGSQRSLRGTGAQRSLRSTSAQRALRGSGYQQSVWDTGSQRSLRDSGSQRSLWDTGAQRSVRDSGTQRPPWDDPPWDDPVQETGWEEPTRQDGWELPRRASGALQMISDDSSGQPRHAAGGERRSRGLLPGAVAGFLAAAVAIGVANLVAAFVRPQASPIIAVGEAFIDRTPPALKNFAVQKFGENDKNMLLLGMYVTIALIAVVIGILAWRRVAIGVAGIGLFGLFGAFVAITRPESHVTDVIPSVAGGIAGIATIVWLVRAGRPASRYRPRWTGGNS